MVLQNYLMLEEGVPARVHFSDHVIEKRTITDPLTGQPTTRNVLVFDVDLLNGLPVFAKYSIMAEKHASQFAAYLEKKQYRDYNFTITMSGEGFRRSWSLQVIPMK